SRLMEYAEAEGIDIIIPEYIKDHSNAITEWEAGSLYDLSFSIRIDTLKKCYEIITEWEKQI
ncbi:MAG: hypothetical protein IK001_04760, partial [Lachnospiraceae bacterium]|nr:hypothetical protein [Lachnospiraceae bacterium]